jgi:2'-5' RNA ligase
MSFLGIRIPSEIGNVLKKIEVPGDKTDTSDMHITILCFKNDMPIHKIAKATEATYDVIKDFSKFQIKINKTTCFPKRRGHPAPIIIPVISDELQELHKKLCKSFDKYHVKYSQTFKEYNPHITLSYNNKEIKDFKIDNVKIPVSELVLWSGDEGITDNNVYITFPLQENHKHSALEYKVNLFYKLASMIY